VCGMRDRSKTGRNPLSFIPFGCNLFQVTIAPIITGERVLRRWLIDAIPETCWSGYAIETAMNHTAGLRGARTVLFFMRGVQVRDKTEKTGILSGLSGYWKMFHEMHCTKGALNGSGGAHC